MMLSSQTIEGLKITGRTLHVGVIKQCIAPIGLHDYQTTTYHYALHISVSLSLDPHFGTVEIMCIIGQFVSTCIHLSSSLLC